MKIFTSKWITKKEAGQYLKLSVRSIENLVNKGVLKAHRIGGRVLLNIEELDMAVQGGQSHGSIINRNEQ